MEARGTLSISNTVAIYMYIIYISGCETDVGTNNEKKRSCEDGIQSQYRVQGPNCEENRAVGSKRNEKRKRRRIRQPARRDRTCAAALTTSIHARSLVSDQMSKFWIYGTCWVCLSPTTESYRIQFSTDIYLLTTRCTMSIFNHHLIIVNSWSDLFLSKRLSWLVMLISYVLELINKWSRTELSNLDKLKFIINS